MRSLMRMEFLEVVAVPGHERDEHVAPKRQFSKLGRGAVGDDVALSHPIAHTHQRALVDAGALVAAHELAQSIDVHALGRAIVGRGPHHNARAVDLVDHPRPLGHNRRPGVTGHGGFHAGAHQRRVGADQRHRLALHVRAHQRAVGVVVLQERDQRRGHRHKLLRRHVHGGHVLGLHQPEIALLAHRDEILGEPPVAVHRRIGLGDDQLLLFHGRQVARLALHHPVLHQHVRRLDEAVLVHLGIGGKRVDQADVRAFRRLDRADAAVMRRVHVAHLEAGALAGQSARPKRGQAALMGHFRQRIGLVHELRQLAAAEELAYRGSRGLRVDQVVRHHRVDIHRAHALADGPLHAQQADAVLVLHQLAHRAHPAVAQVVDVVDGAAAVLQFAQDLHRAQDVLLAQHADAVRHIKSKAHVHLHAPDRGQVIAVGIEEQAAEQRLGGVRRGRLARAHHPVDVDQRIVAVAVLVHRQRVADPRAVGLVHRQRRQGIDAAVLECRELGLGQFLASLDIDLAGFLVDQVLGHVAAQQIGAADQHHAGGLGDLARLAGGELRLGLGHHLAGLGVDQRLQQLDATESVRVERARPALGRAGEHHLTIEDAQDFFGVHAAYLARLHLLATRHARLPQGRRVGGIREHREAW